MYINPFYFLMSVYLISNFIGLISGLFINGFYMVGNFHSVSNTSFVVAFLMQLLTITAIIYFYKINMHGLLKKINSESLYLGNTWSYLLIIIQISYIIFFKTTGAGIAGSDFSFHGSSYINYIFVLFNPDYIGFLLIPLIRNNRLFFISLFLFLISFTLRGWLGGVVFVVLIYLCRYYPYKLKYNRLYKLSLLFLIMIFLIPFFESAKWGIRTGLDLDKIFYNAIQVYSFEALVSGFLNVVQRFSHIHNLAFVLENKEFFHEALYDGFFRSFWANGLLYETACRIFESCQIDLNTYMVTNGYDIGGKVWNVDPGFSAWFFIVHFYSIVPLLLFGFLLISFKPINVLNVFGERYVLLYYSLCLVYFFNGWIASFMNIFLYMISFVFLMKIKRG